MSTEHHKHPKHPHLYTCLGEVIYLRRKWLGITQEDLAKKTGIDRAFISNVERGKRTPSFGTVANIADGLKMRYSRLVTKCEECSEHRKKTG